MINSIMGESISGLPAVYDCDAIENTLVIVVPDDIVTTANVNLDSLDNKFYEKCIPETSIVVEVDKEIVFSESEDLLKENVSNNIGVSKLNKFDSSTPKSMLRKPVSKELYKKMEFLTQKQLRQSELSQYAKEEHVQNMRHKQELHEQELQFKNKMHKLIFEKCDYETEKAKFDF